MTWSRGLGSTQSSVTKNEATRSKPRGIGRTKIKQLHLLHHEQADVDDGIRCAYRFATTGHSPARTGTGGFLEYRERAVRLVI